MIEGLTHVSYSSLMDFKRCPQYFFYKHIQKLAREPNNIYTIYGSLLHKYVPLCLFGENNKQEYIEKFLKSWKKFCNMYKKYINQDDDLAAWGEAGRIILEDINNKFKEKFGNYTSLESEKCVKVDLEKYVDMYLKGFVDIILKTEQNKWIIADFKNCSSSYMFYKNKDKYKDYQLCLYKHSFCKMNEVNPKDVSTCFVLLERNPRSKNVVSFLDITSGNIKIKNSLEFLNNVLRNCEKGFFPKIKSSCVSFGKPCIFSSICNS